MPTTPAQDFVVAINPAASFGARSDVGPAVVQTLRALGHRVTSLTEPDFDSLTVSAAAAVKRRPDALIVVGGDGMVNLGTNLVAGTRVPLGIVPSGTGNDSARGLGIPLDDTEAAMRALESRLARPARRIDAGRVSWTDATGRRGSRWFASVLSAGFDAIVNERANSMRHPRGPARYTLAMLAELVRLRPIEYRLTLDGHVVESAGLLACVANGVSIGGGMRVTPDAEFDDGLFDVMLVEPMSRLSFLRLFPKVFRGEHVSDARVTIRRARHVRIEAAGVVAYADGERFAPLPVEAEVIPGALRVLA